MCWHVLTVLSISTSHLWILFKCGYLCNHYPLPLLTSIWMMIAQFSLMMKLTVIKPNRGHRLSPHRQIRCSKSTGLKSKRCPQMWPVTVYKIGCWPTGADIQYLNDSEQPGRPKAEVQFIQGVLTSKCYHIVGFLHAISLINYKR